MSYESVGTDDKKPYDEEIKDQTWDSPEATVIPEAQTGEDHRQRHFFARLKTGD